MDKIIMEGGEDMKMNAADVTLAYTLLSALREYAERQGETAQNNMTVDAGYWVDELIIRLAERVIDPLIEQLNEYALKEVNVNVEKTDGGGRAE